jgi:hypothetical protein
MALVAAATCTLRQNYQATVGAFLVFTYAFAVFGTRARTPLRARLVEPAIAFALVGLCVLPWLVLLYRSNDTFLFPLMKGTFRPGVDVRSQVMTAGKYIRSLAEVWLSPEPITTMPLFFLVGFWLHERSPRRVLASQWLGAFASVALLVWSFSLANAGNLARYNYGFFTASALLTWQTCAAQLRVRRTLVFRELATVGVLAFAILTTLENGGGLTRQMIDTRLRDTSEMLRRTVPAQGEPPVAGAYHRMQNAIPEGSRVLIMLDQPYFLDYRRNTIFNLDMPGTASPAPSIPCFRGPEPVAEYLLANGIRYVMFVDPEHSTWLYRRDIWFDHLYDREEIWRIYAPYMVDVMDNLVGLSKIRRKLHEEAGMVVVDVQARAP